MACQHPLPSSYTITARTKDAKLTAVFPIQKAVLKVVAVLQYALDLAENRTINKILATTLRKSPMALRTSYVYGCTVQPWKSTERLARIALPRL
jgi:hypothetical protein